MKITLTLSHILKMKSNLKCLAHACKASDLEMNLKKTVVMHDPVSGLPYIEPAKYIEWKKLNTMHCISWRHAC